MKLELIINALEAIGTCAAVVVALFLDEIRALFKKVTIDIKLSNNEALEDLVNIRGVKTAKRYFNHVEFFNKGNVNAQNCELFLENADFFIDRNCKCANSMCLYNEPISWNNVNKSVYIPSQGKKILQIFEMTAPQKQTNPDGKIDNQIPAKYNFLGLDSVEAKKGRWELTYCLYSLNSKPRRFRYIVEWDGSWEDRQKEMNALLTMKLEKI